MCAYSSTKHLKAVYKGKGIFDYGTKKRIFRLIKEGLKEDAYVIELCRL